MTRWYHLRTEYGGLKSELWGTAFRGWGCEERVQGTNLEQWLLRRGENRKPWCPESIVKMVAKGDSKSPVSNTAHRSSRVKNENRSLDLAIWRFLLILTRVWVGRRNKRDSSFGNTRGKEELVLVLRWEK